MTPTLEQLLSVPHVDTGCGFDLSPDGARLAFSWNRSGSWELYEISFATAGALGTREQIETRLLTSPPGAKFHPRYSPDGLRLAYALDLDGSESFHIAILDLLTAEHRDLTPDIAFAHQPNMSWSPDGRQLAVLSDAGGHFTLYLLPANGGEPLLMLDVEHPCWDAHWSPDGEWIAVEAEWHRQDRTIFLVNVQDGSKRQLQQDEGVLNAMHPTWSPDGRTLAFCGDPLGWYRLGLYNVAKDTIRWLDGTDGDETEPAWSLGGQRIVCLRTKGADTALCIHDLSNQTITSHRLGPGIYAHPRFSHDGRCLLFSFESPRQPPDLWHLDLAHGTFGQLTRSLADDLDTGDFAIPEQIWYRSTDGAIVPAMLYRPPIPGASALVSIHGGPNWLVQCNWHPLMSYLSAQGWAVLAPNYRGSTGYGREWQQANHMRLGEVDTSDCAAAAGYLVQQGLADPARIVVSGRSHGGYLTMTCLTDYPHLWAGGSAVVPFLNWFTCHASSRPDLQHWDIENFGDPMQNAELWRRRSPFFYLDQITAAVQLICGAHDPRCPASESMAACDRLLELGKDVELVLYPDEGHGFLKLDNVIDQELKRLKFLERAVGA